MANNELRWVEPAASGLVPLPDLAVHLHLQDNVAITKVPLSPGTRLVLQVDEGSPIHIPVRGFIPAGHKVALQEIAPGASVRRFGHVIGVAIRPILPGEHVHTHNLGLEDLARDYAFGADAHLIHLAPEGERRSFLGYRRADGRVGTRNYIAVIATMASRITCSW